MREWFLSSELIAIETMPNTVAGISKKASRENWKSRKASGGGRSLEYHISNFDMVTKYKLLENANDPNAYDELPTPPSEYVSLTYYDVEASAGHGSLVEVETATEVSFSERYLRDDLHVNPSEVFLMKAKGDSMYPTLKDGSLVMVKRVSDFSGDGVYVFRVNGQVMIKRLQFQPTKIIFKSDNAQFYEPWELTHQEIESVDFQILGQAVWGGGKL